MTEMRVGAEFAFVKPTTEADQLAAESHSTVLQDYVKKSELGKVREALELLKPLEYRDTNADKDVKTTAWENAITILDSLTSPKDQTP